MKALKINVVTQQIEEIELKDGYGLKAIYDAIGNGCNLFECPITFDNGDTIYCDENGLLKEPIGAFMMKDWAYPIQGNGLLVGTDIYTGESIPVKTSAEELASQIQFLDEHQAELWIGKMMMGF
jgi:hypothetical protein